MCVFSFNSIKLLLLKNERWGTTLPLWKVVNLVVRRNYSIFSLGTSSLWNCTIRSLVVVNWNLVYENFQKFTIIFDLLPLIKGPAECWPQWLQRNVHIPQWLQRNVHIPQWKIIIFLALLQLLLCVTIVYYRFLLSYLPSILSLHCIGVDYRDIIITVRGVRVKLRVW